MTDETIRIGFVGAGDNTRVRHIPGFRRQEGVELVSVCNRSRESSQRISDEFDIPVVYDNWLDLVQADDTNAICIGTWPYTHRTMVLAALEANKHVQVEARLSMNAPEAYEMLAASQAKPHLITQVIPAPHTLMVDNMIRDLIADGYIGDLLSMDMRSSSPYRTKSQMLDGGFIDRSAPIEWRQDRDLSGNNIMHMGIWYESVMRWIGHVSSVLAQTRVNVPMRPNTDGTPAFISIPDQVEILCDTYSGALVHIQFSDVFGLAAPSQIWFYGTEGTICLDGEKMTLTGGRKGDDKLSPIEVPPEKVKVERMEEEFINAIRGLEPITHTSFEFAVKYVEFTEAVKISAQTGQKIHLPL
jgi:predicted dehydrogenase